MNGDRAATTSSEENKESILPSEAINLMNTFPELQDKNEDCGLVQDDDDISLTKVVSFESTKKTSQQQGSISKNDATSSETTSTNNNQQNHGVTLKTTQENNYNNKTTTRDSPVILIGDSMIKNIIPRKISKRQIIKRTFPIKDGRID